MIEISNIRRIYGRNNAEVIALNGVTLTIADGEMVALTGPSGSGKTTLLNILGCIDKATSGHYLLDGRYVSDCKPTELAKLRNKHFGFVVQDFMLIDTYTVHQNIALPLRYNRSVSPSERRAKVRGLLERLGIAEKENTFPTKLSGGQKQRVAIARALVNDASVILADEPTGALDRRTGQEIVRLFREINAEGRTIIIVTHDQNVAEQCDRIIQLEDGRIVNDTDRKSNP